MSAVSFALILALTTVLMAEFVNGWTDAPNVIATVVSTGVMSPRAAILMAVIMGGTPLGAPIAGWVADTLGPRWSLGVGALAGLIAALIGLLYMARTRHLRLSLETGRLRVKSAGD